MERVGQVSIIQHYKGFVSLEYATHKREIQEWSKGTQYTQGEIVYQDISDPNDIHYDDSWYTHLGLWSVCMKDHIADDSNMPHDDEIFTDIVIDLIPHIQLLLIKHVQGFNTYLAGLVTNFAYKTNDFWWNGCAGGRAKRISPSWSGCGNLVASLDGKYCKKCKIAKNTDLKDNIPYNIGIKIGSTISMNKDTRQLERNIVNENKSEDEAENQNEEITKTLFLNDNVRNDLKKLKIFNLFCRNFNPSMKGLIKCCIEGDQEWIYDDGSSSNGKHTVKLGDVRIWALYNDYNQNELLCALIWRTVMNDDAELYSLLMFEVLFLSTSEHVRYQHYGQEMVKRIIAFCRSNCYDIITVAAVPRHGVAFWKNNGFEMKYDPTGKYKDDDKKKTKKKKQDNGYRYSEWEHGHRETGFIGFMRDNMLKFQDTPLFAKFLT